MTSEFQKIQNRINELQGIAYAIGETVTSNKNINHESCLGYSFFNFSNVPVSINGMFLDRYYSGMANAPTVISGAFNNWTPQMNAGEIDTSIYVVKFLDKFYPGVTPIHKLIVMRKGIAQVTPGNR